MFLKNPIKTNLARELRKNATEAEKIAWDLLRGSKYKGLKFRRQFVMEGFVLDFYCIKEKLAIEIDGLIHEKQKDYDCSREEVLIASRGIRFIRIKNQTLMDNPEELYKQIDLVLKPLSD